MDIQAIWDAINSAAARTRSDYHLTLGELTEFIKEHNYDVAVYALLPDGTRASLGEEHSYRGHYEDLSFTPCENSDEHSNVASVREMCERAASQTYEGYKGGDYEYDDKTPLWLADEGCSGLAMIGIAYDMSAHEIIITTKRV